MSPRRFDLLIRLAGCIGLAACANAAAPNTGLVGAVARSPIGPTCSQGQLCVEPFSAHFTVRQGIRVVALFQSDEQGRYTVRLEPGTYRIVPGPDAPILNPTSQGQTAVVGSSGLTTVNLTFDSGIR